MFYQQDEQAGLDISALATAAPRHMLRSRMVVPSHFYLTMIFSKSAFGRVSVVAIKLQPAPSCSTDPLTPKTTYNQLLDHRTRQTTHALKASILRSPRCFLFILPKNITKKLTHPYSAKGPQNQSCKSCIFPSQN